MKTSIANNPVPEARDMCLFLLEYSAWLLGSGSTCIRLEKNVQRIAQTYGMNVELSIMPRHIHMTVWEKDREKMFTSIVSVRHTSISFNIITRLR